MGNQLVVPQIALVCMYVYRTENNHFVEYIASIIWMMFWGFGESSAQLRRHISPPHIPTSKDNSLERCHLLSSSTTLVLTQGASKWNDAFTNERRF